jgi:hypothetical protein
MTTTGMTTHVVQAEHKKDVISVVYDNHPDVTVIYNVDSL